MAETSSIEWTDSTFNPWEGCQKVGPGCDHCYAENRNARFGGGVAVNWGPGAPRRRTSASNWAKPLLWEREHEAFALMHGRRRRVFCASLADVFDNEVDPAWRADLFALIDRTPHLDWLLLTKRIGNVVGMVPLGWLSDPGWPAHVAIGATLVNQPEVDRDGQKLVALPAPVRFISYEPALGPIDIRHLLGPQCDAGSVRHPAGGGVTCPSCQGTSRTGCPGISWVICGGESGPGARPMHPDWARSLRDQCAAAGVPYLFKQWGEWAPFGKPSHYPAGVAPDGSLVGPDEQFTDDCALVYRVGKQASGRLLDGRTHDGFPEPRA